jgi:Rrf2 family transcriptional regulator, cysteine metabolism repressor
MMKLSTKGRYGVRLMLELAGKFGKGPVSLKDVSKHQEISEKYLWHLMRQLKNAGLVHSARGAHGGYMLAKPPKRINLKDIVSALEGPMNLVACTHDPQICKRSADCVARQIWTEITDKFLHIIESYNLEDMLMIQKAKRQTVDYTI